MPLTYIRVTITLLSPWRVGTSSEDRSKQATLTDRSGGPVIPPSSLAGSFRSHLGDDAERLMGKAAEEESRASSVWFLGTRLVGADGKEPKVEERTGTSISRVRKAARAKGSHAIEEVYNAERVELYLRCDQDGEEILRRLATWTPTVGGGITTGLGRAKVTAIRYRTVDIGNPADVLARVTMGVSGPEGLDRLLRKGEDQPIEAAEVPVVVSATLDIEDYLLAGREKDKESKRAFEFRWYHGSRWKGVLRSRVEYIGRSIGAMVCGAEDGTWEGCGHCSVCEVFGSGTTGAGRWMFEFTRLDAPPPLGGVRTRNAIDRFTGGVLDKRLFYEDTSTTRGASLSITERVPLEKHHAWVVKALLLALKDLNDGYFGIGGRSATGLGTVRVRKWVLGPGVRDVVGDPGIGELPRITDDDLTADREAHSQQEQQEKESVDA